MHLEGCGLPAMGIHEGQFLSKSATTIFAFETPRQEMQKGLFTPHIQMPDALLDELSLKASRSVYTRQPPRGEHTKNAGLHVLLRDELHTFFYHHGRNVQQFGQGLSATSLNSFWLIRFTAFAASFTKNVIYTAVVSWEILQGIFPMFTYTNQEKMSRKK
jgi:hypothetical protein